MEAVEEEAEEEAEVEEEALQLHRLRLHPVPDLQEEEEEVVVVEVADHPRHHLLHRLPHQWQLQILQMTN